MKKIFFPKSSASHGDEHHENNSRRIRERKQQPAKTRPKTGSSEQCFPFCDSKVVEGKTLSARRSRTLSMSAAAYDSTRCSEDLISNRHKFSHGECECECSDCHCKFVDRNSKPERYTDSSTPSIPSSPHTSFGSSSTIGRVWDLYMDGDHPQQKHGMKDHRLNVPARVQNRGFSDNIPRNDSWRSEHQRESPRKLAKDVVGKLLRLEQSRVLKPGDICDKYLDEQSCRYKDGMSRKGDTLRDVLDEDTFKVNNNRVLLEREYQIVFPEENGDAVDLEIRRKLEEVSEQNAFLQREVSSFYDKERGYADKISQIEANFKDKMAKLEETRAENDNLQKMLSDVYKKLNVSEEIQSCNERNFKQIVEENAKLVESAARLQWTCSDQGNTIDGLRLCLSSEMDGRQTSEKTRKVTHKLLLEQSRLAESEQVLRRRLETCAAEVQSLRTENMYLLERLRDTGEVSGHSSLKLDQELNYHVQCLKNTGLSLLNESIRTCGELLQIVGRTESSKGIQEKHTIDQYNIKVQGLKRGLDELTRSLAKTGVVLKEKAEIDFHKPDLLKTNDRVLIEGDLITELKAESLVTSILKEKLYSKEREVERVQAELARALCSHEGLKSEIQDTFDTVSCLNHKMKNFELQMIEKDGTINQLRGEVWSQEEELGSTKRTLSNVSQERELIWEEVKRYAEKNMLLNMELESLKKKVDALEEDTLLKDGQISILKDSINDARHFGALLGADRGEFFKL